MKQKTLKLLRASLILATFMGSSTLLFAQSQLGTNSNSNAIDSTGNIGIGTSNPN